LQIIITVNYQTNFAEPMRDKWGKRKKGYLKIHVAVNIKNKKKIFSMKVTDEHVYDSKALSGLVEDIVKSDNSMIPIGKLFAMVLMMMVMNS